MSKHQIGCKITNFQCETGNYIRLLVRDFGFLTMMVLMMAMMVSEIGGLAIGQTALMGQKWLVSADSQEFNLEDEGRTARDSGLGEFAVAHLCRDVQFPLVADNHLLQCHNPTVYQVAEPDGQWRAAITRVKV